VTFKKIIIILFFLTALSSLSVVTQAQDNFFETIELIIEDPSRVVLFLDIPNKMGMKYKFEQIDGQLYFLVFKGEYEDFRDIFLDRNLYQEKLVLRKNVKNPGKTGFFRVEEGWYTVFFLKNCNPVTGGCGTYNQKSEIGPVTLKLTLKEIPFYLTYLPIIIIIIVSSFSLIFLYFLFIFFKKQSYRNFLNKKLDEKIKQFSADNIILDRNYLKNKTLKKFKFILTYSNLKKHSVVSETDA